MSKRIEKLAAKVAATKATIHIDEISSISSVKVCVRSLPRDVASVLAAGIDAAIQHAANDILKLSVD